MAAHVNASRAAAEYHKCFHPDLLRGKVAFVTGGGSGICYTISEVLMRHGCRTVIASRKMDRLKQAATDLHKLTGQECLPVQMDVRNPPEVLSAVDAALSKFGKIDFLINGAAGNFLCPAASMSFNAFKTVMEIDAMGTFNVTKAVFDKYMKDNGGVVVNISATLPIRGTPLQAHSSSAKAAVDTLTKVLATEWGPMNIRVVGVAPGPIADTEGMERLAGSIQEHVANGIPLRKLGNKLDIGYCVLYLLSPVGSYITGHTLIVDGGQWMTADFNRFQAHF